MAAAKPKQPKVSKAPVVEKAESEVKVDVNVEPEKKDPEAPKVKINQVPRKYRKFQK